MAPSELLLLPTFRSRCCYAVARLCPGPDPCHPTPRTWGTGSASGLSVSAKQKNRSVDVCSGMGHFSVGSATCLGTICALL